MSIPFGDSRETIGKDQSALEMVAYRDMWGKGTDSYLNLMYEHFLLIRELLSENGVLSVHVGWLVYHYIKAILDDVFGTSRFVNQIIWKRQTAHSDIGQGSKHLGRIHDVIFLYSKGESYIWNMQYEPYSNDYAKKFYKHVDPKTERVFQLGDLTAPGGASKRNPHYEFLGITRYWRYSKERMTALHKQGRIIQQKPENVPRLRDLAKNKQTIIGQNREYQQTNSPNLRAGLGCFHIFQSGSANTVLK